MKKISRLPENIKKYKKFGAFYFFHTCLSLPLNNHTIKILDLLCIVSRIDLFRCVIHKLVANSELSGHFKEKKKG